MLIDEPFGLLDRRPPPLTLDGWQQFVDDQPATFELLPDDEWKNLSELDRDTYDDERIAYHAELVTVATSTMMEIHHQGRLLTLVNQRELGARRGLIVSGVAGTGKSTSIRQLGRAHELRIRRQFSDSDRIPVVYVTAPPKGSPRKLAVEFARFLGLPPIRVRQNVTDISDAVCQVLLDCRTDLIIVDEIHNLDLATRSGEELSDHLKYFTEHLPATFVYAGVQVAEPHLFTGTRGKQIGGRFVLVESDPFPYTEEWRSLLASMEGALRLHRHSAGELDPLAQYMHRRTGGMIGSLSHLIRAAALTAIIDRTERITRKTMESVKLDHNAEQKRRSTER